MDAIEHPEFDVAMICTAKTDNLRRSLFRITDDVAEIKERLTSWLSFTMLDLLSIVQQSAYATPSAIAHMTSILRPEFINRALKCLCGVHQIPLPKEISVGRFASAMGQLITTFGPKEGDTGDVTKFLKCMLKIEQKLKDLALAMMANRSELQRTVTNALKDSERQTEVIPVCLQQQLHSKEKKHQFFRIRSDADAKEAREKIEVTKSDIILSFRVTNNPAYMEMFGVVAWRVREDARVFVFDCLQKMTSESQALVQDLLAQPLVTCEAPAFSEACAYTFNRTPAHVRQPTVPGSFTSISLFSRLANKAKKEYCGRTKHHVLLESQDISDHLIHHLAAEIDLLPFDG